MRILVYFPTNKNSNSIETVVKYFCDSGNEVFFLTFDPLGPIHNTVKEYGAKVFCANIYKGNPLFFYPSQIWFLVCFIWKKKIKLVYSHQQQPNMISGIAQYFVRAKVILCRHHTDSGSLYHNKKEMFGDRIVNFFGKLFIAPGQKVFDQIIKEGVSPRKIRIIPYAYDFSRYPKPDPQVVESIRKEFSSSLLLVKVARLVPDKRHILLFEAIKYVVKNHSMNIKLMVLSDGPERDTLTKFVKENGLEGNIFFVGFKQNVVDYISAADLLIHISITEASNSIIKEAGLCFKPVVACNDVGDFDDYLIDKENSLVIDKHSPYEELVPILIKAFEDKTFLLPLGALLHTTILERFSYENIMPMYDELHQELFGKS